jgi:hypothetical protein
VTEIPDDFDHWCVVDLFGRQRFAGRVRKAEFPSGFLRLDVPATPGHGALTQLYNPSAVYGLSVTTEEIATATAARCRPEPVHRWELPALAGSPGAQPIDVDAVEEFTDYEPY